MEMAEFGYIPGRSKSRIYLLISSVNGKFGYSLSPRKWLSLAVRFLYTLLGDTWDCKFTIDKQCMSFNRCLVKSAYQKIDFLISQPKYMLWVLKRTVSMRRLF